MNAPFHRTTTIIASDAIRSVTNELPYNEKLCIEVHPLESPPGLNSYMFLSQWNYEPGLCLLMQLLPL